METESPSRRSRETDPKTPRKRVVCGLSAEVVGACFEKVLDTAVDSRTTVWDSSSRTQSVRPLSQSELANVSLGLLPVDVCVRTTLKAAPNSRPRWMVPADLRKKFDIAPETNVLVSNLACADACGHPDESRDASHRCWDGQCINPAHITWEDAKYNNTRECCRMFCNLVDYVCPHNPPCLGVSKTLYKGHPLHPHMDGTGRIEKATCPTCGRTAVIYRASFASKDLAWTCCGV